MNKKILSFVLAMVLSVGLGSNVFAYNYDGGTDRSGSISMSSVYDQYDTGEFDRSGGSKTTVDGAKDTTNRICAVFNYASGVVLSMMDQDKTITLYNAGSPFLTLTYNEATGNEGFGNYTISGMTISGSDYETVMNCGGLRSFLEKCGVSDQALQCSETTTEKDGSIEVNKNKQVEVAWIDKAESFLSRGINHTISINFTASGGASVTFAVNGKQMETIGYDGAQLQQYNYNVAGTLETIDQLTYEVDDVDSKEKKNSTEVNKVSYKAAHTTVHIDQYGRQSYATDIHGNVTTRYTYSSNGSMFSIQDLTTNNTTYYSGGHAGFVLNDTGFKTTEYFYHENGSLDGVKSYNYNEEANKVSETSISAYRYGKFIGSATLADIEPNQISNFDELRKAVDNMKLYPDLYEQSLKNGAVNNLKDSDIKKKIGNTTYTWNGSGWVDNKGNQVTDDITEALKQAEKEYKANPANQNKDGSLKKEFNKDAAKKKYVEVTADVYSQLTERGAELSKIAGKNKSPYANLTSVGLYLNDLNNKNFMSVYKDMFYAGSNKDFLEDINNMAKMSNGSSMIGQLNLTIDAKAFDTQTKDVTTNKTVVKDGGTVTNGRDIGRTSTQKSTKQSTSTSTKVTQVGKVGQQITGKLTIMDHGMQCYQVQLKSCTLRDSQDQIITRTTTNTDTVTVTKVADPAVEGELWPTEGTTEEEIMAMAKKLGIDTSDEKAMDDLRSGFYTDASGQTFAIVNANSVNIMDGKGFHAAEGETIMVAVDKGTKEAIKENVKNTGDKSIMFMGNVRESSNGYITMTMDVSYGGGMVQGSEAIKEAKKEITELSQKVADAKADLKANKIDQAEYDSIVKDSGWVGQNTDANINSFANGGYSWDADKTKDGKDNRTIAQKLFNAWQALF